jgi:DNA-binding transcriptional MerR regulator
MSHYTAGELAKACNVTVRTVQYYHERGLLLPSTIGTGGRRIYTDDDLKRLKLICLLRSIDLSLDDIDNILKDHSVHSDIAFLLNEHAYLLKNEIF